MTRIERKIVVRSDTQDKNPRFRAYINLKFPCEEKYIDHISYRYDFLLLAACYSKPRGNSFRRAFVFLALNDVLRVLFNSARFPKSLLDIFQNEIRPSPGGVANGETREISRLLAFNGAWQISASGVMRRRAISSDKSTRRPGASL